jgi:hypothetical protein
MSSVITTGLGADTFRLPQADARSLRVPKGKEAAWRIGEVYRSETLGAWDLVDKDRRPKG